MATYYRWRKSTVSWSPSQVKTNKIQNPTSNYYYFTGTTAAPDIGDGTSGIPAGNYDLSSFTAQFYFTCPEALSGGANRWIAETTLSAKTIYKITEYTEIDASGNCHVSVIRYTTVSSPDTFVEYVYNTSSSAYPNSGVSGNYYYDQRTTVTSPTAPSGISYPATITTPSVTVSWTAATSNTDYPVNGYQVDVSTNGGSSWTSAGTPTRNSLTYPITPGTTSIRFRVRAKDSNGQWGDYATGADSQVLLAPTLTVPQMVMQGQQATISWTAIDGADSYTLQRKSSADADWTQVYSGANLAFSETVGTWTTVQYRVQAVFSDTPGGWAESASIPVVSSSALVISGTDEDLGIVTNDIPYSISTDTGNQITATITVNNAVIFSGNVGNSTADVIPVLDLITGEGTIVISATVEASGSPVTATRTWTYEKAAITFPNSGSVAQVTKEGENIYPKVLAEGVRLPGGKTLDQVMGFPAQIYTGSYVGTGTYGQSNPNTLTLPFVPKVVFVTRKDSFLVSSAFVGFVWLFGQDTITSSGPTTFTVNDNGLSWYSNGASNQLNVSGTNYVYVALG